MNKVKYFFIGLAADLWMGAIIISSSPESLGRFRSYCFISLKNANFDISDWLYILFSVNDDSDFRFQFYWRTNMAGGVLASLLSTRVCAVVYPYSQFVQEIDKEEPIKKIKTTGVNFRESPVF